MLSIKRAKTNDSDTAEQLIQKAKAPFKLNKPRLISENSLHPQNIYWSHKTALQD